MNSKRIKEIQDTTAYPESVSVKQALLQVWNECEQEQLKLCGVGVRREQLVCDHPESKITWRRSSDSSFCHKCSNIVKQTN